MKCQNVKLVLKLDVKLEISLTKEQKKLLSKLHIFFYKYFMWPSLTLHYWVLPCLSLSDMFRPSSDQILSCLTLSYLGWPSLTLAKILGLAIHGQAENGEAHIVASQHKLIISPCFASAIQGYQEFVENITLSATQWTKLYSSDISQCTGPAFFHPPSIFATTKLHNFNRPRNVYHFFSETYFTLQGWCKFLTLLKCWCFVLAKNEGGWGKGSVQCHCVTVMLCGSLSSRDCAVS